MKTVTPLRAAGSVTAGLIAALGLAAVGLFGPSFLRTSGPVAPASAQVRPRAAQASVPPEAPETEPLAVRDVAFASAHTLLPPECLPGDGTFDLVLFFHGNPASLKRSFALADFNAALMVENVGIISAAYVDRFGYELAFKVELDRALKMVTEACPLPGRRLGRIALAGWSAGFGAVTRMLNYPAVADRVDAVLLADGFHSAFIDPRNRTLPPDAFASVERFARRAMAGEKLLVITHSEIATPEYASTTESTNFLLRKLGLERQAPDPSEPWPKMQRLSQVRKGLFFLEGFKGGDERAHAQHLHAVGELFLKRVRDYWTGALGKTSSPLAVASAAAAPVNVTVEVRGDVVCTQAGAYVDCRADEPAEPALALAAPTPLAPAVSASPASVPKPVVGPLGIDTANILRALPAALTGPADQK